MIQPIVAIIGGLILLVWSADKFVEGAASAAKHFKLPALLIGMVIVGFGTSMPEMTVSALAALQNNPGIALGNAYGSNIANIGLILGVSVLISPITVNNSVIKKEIPMLIAITALSSILIFNGFFSRIDAIILLAVFALIMYVSISKAIKDSKNTPIEDNPPSMSLKASIIWTIIGLAVLIVSSRLLVWGAVSVAAYLGVSDLIVGLTVVAVGTSLPELASSIMAARKNEHDLALGNVLGSNLFNTLMVVGIAGAITPFSVPKEVLTRDMPIMAGFTVLLLIFCLGKNGKAKINRLEGAILFAGYIAYTIMLIKSI